MAGMDCAPPGTDVIELESKSGDTDTKDEADIESKILTLKVNLDDGTSINVFSRNGYNNNGLFVYNCNICKVQNLAASCLQMHINGRKHQNKFLLPALSAKLYYAQTKKAPTKASDMCLAPGEPVPPGFEGEIKGVAEIQAALDDNKSPLIGLEYLVELIGDKREPQYVCILCDKKGDPRTVMAHLISYNHRLLYLRLHYPSVHKALLAWRTTSKDHKRVLGIVVQNVIEAIENKFGRLTPFVVDYDLFETDKDKYINEARRDKHFSEQNGPDFVELAQENAILQVKEKMYAEERKYVDNVDSGKKRMHSPDYTSEKKKRNDDRKFPDEKKDYDDISSISSSSLSRSRSRSRSRERYYRSRGNDYNKKYAYRRSRSRSYSPDRYRNRYYRRSRSRSKSRSRSPSRNMKVVYAPYDRDLYRKPRRLWGLNAGRGASSGFDRTDRKPFATGPPLANKQQVEPKRQIAPTPKELIQQASQISNVRYNLEKYRFAVEITETEMAKVLKMHEKCPEKHPLYPEEWKKFWNRRYKELQAENKDPGKHDFKGEWIKFWTERMKHLHKIELENKLLKLREKYNIKENAEEENVTNLKEQFILKVKPNLIDPNEIIVLDDDRTSDIQSAASTKSENKRSSRSVKSASPWDDDDDFDTKPRRTAKLVREPQERKKSYDEWAKEYYGPNKSRTTYVRELPTRIESSKDIVYPALDPSEPLNIVSVLRLLTALEDLLGSLGPKIINMLSTALAMEKTKANSAEDLLLNDANNVMFETVKEKLKGQLFAGILETQKVHPVKTAIQKIAALLHQASEKLKLNEEAERKVLAQKKLEPVSVPGVGAVDKAAIAKQIAAALVAQGKPNVTTDELEQLINAVVGMANASQSAKKPLTTAAYLAQLQASPKRDTEKYDTVAESIPVSFKSTSLVPQYDKCDEPKDPMDDLSDSDLKMLLQNFSNLSNDEQHGLILYLKKLESKEPDRVEKLRKFVNLDPSENATGNQSKSDMVHHGGSGRMSPFSNRKGGTNPSADETGVSRNNSRTPFGESASEQQLVVSDDDDYSYDDVFKAASKNVKEKQLENDMKVVHESLTRDRESSHSAGDMSIIDAKSLIANLMGSLQQKSDGSNQLPLETTSSGYSHMNKISPPINQSQNPNSFYSSSFGNIPHGNFAQTSNKENSQSSEVENYYSHTNDGMNMGHDSYDQNNYAEQFIDDAPQNPQPYFCGANNFNPHADTQYGNMNQQRYGNMNQEHHFANMAPSNNDQQRFGSNNAEYNNHFQQQQQYGPGNQFNMRGRYY